MPSNLMARAVPRLGKSHLQQAARRRFLSLRQSSPYAFRRQQHFVRSILFVTAAGSLTAFYGWCTGSPIFIRDVHAEGLFFASKPRTEEEEMERQTREAKPTPIPAEELVFEEPRKPGPDASKDETRDQISSQHLQVKKSWQNPGVWCWGDNNGKVAAPDGKEGLVRNPRWMKFFEGKLLRDLQLTRTFGAAIAENGDLYQWGTDYSDKASEPVKTLVGKNLTNIAISKDRIIALSSSGNVYSLSVSQEEQQLGPKPTESTWIPFYSSRSPVSYRNLKPPSLGWSERVSHISSGLEHGVMLTTSGRVFTFASGSDEYPTRGQLGVPGLTWFTKPSGPYDQPHEVAALHGFRVSRIAAGDYHSLALDDKGRVFAWGDNQRGQLGIGETSKDITYYDSPAQIPLTRLYAGTAQKPRVTAIYAGGNTSFLTVDAERVALSHEQDAAAGVRGLGRITADTWACGHGIWGQLGNGRWTHVQSLPTKIVPLSGLFEYDERRRRAIPIRVRALSVGASHVGATLDNVTYTEASAATNENDTNWGSDVVFFGNNEFFQLGTGKRNNVVTPTYIQPLDRVAELKEGKRPKQEEHRFHATPRSTVKVGERWVSFEQRVYCGRGVTAVYSGL